MLHPPTTLEEAKKYKYGLAFSKISYKEGRCVMGVWSGGRASTHSQCSRKNGFGPCGLYCKQHDPERVAKKTAAKHAKWDAESAARNARHDRIHECVKACRGIPDPAKALEEARDALHIWEEFVKEELSPFDEPCEATGDDDLCPKCNNVGCIRLKIEALRKALAALTPSQEQP